MLALTLATINQEWQWVARVTRQLLKLERSQGNQGATGKTLFEGLQKKKNELHISMPLGDKLVRIYVHKDAKYKVFTKGKVNHLSGWDT